MTETSFQRANRLAEEAKARARAQGGIDFARYEPLPNGEPLEARDSVEAEVWEQIEWEARRWHGCYDATETVEDIVREVLAELKAEAERRRKVMMTLKAKMAARGRMLVYVDAGSGWLVPVERPLIGA